MAKKTFSDDVAFLNEYADVIILSDSSSDSRIAISPKLQGRVMTSTAGGVDEQSYGWVNRDLIASGRLSGHINVYGGEDRFWIGPEGGQFAVFFRNGAPFDIEHWFTPAAIDAESFELVSHSANHAVFRKDIELENYSKTVFNLRVNREISILEKEQAANELGIKFPETLQMVAFESVNTITNTGTRAWEKESGLLSIWILGMFNPSNSTTIVIPINSGSESELGSVMNDTYFGKVPAERLVTKDGVLFYKGDGNYRSKIGISAQRAQPIFGSYDAANQTLTIIQYNKPAEAAEYVNSMWEIQKEPYKGDVINSYNDGPVKQGASSLGSFYELETSSPAAALKSNETITHIHRTIHLQGPKADLDTVAKAKFGVAIAEIVSVFTK